MKITREVLMCDICKEQIGIEGQQEIEKCIVCGKDIYQKDSIRIDLRCDIDGRHIFDYTFSRGLVACKDEHSKKDIILHLIETLSKLLVKYQ